MAILATMTINILKYIKKILNFKISIYLYWKFLDYLNIIYTITSITSFGFKDINFLVLLKISDISNVKKIIIFVNNIEKSIILEKHF